MDNKEILKDYLMKRRRKNLSDRTLADDEAVINKFFEYLEQEGKVITVKTIAE